MTISRLPAFLSAGALTLLTLLTLLTPAGPAARQVMNRMQAMPTDDNAPGQGRIREDARKIHPTALFE